MKRIISVLMIITMVLCMTSCGEPDKKNGKESEKAEIAMIADSSEIKDGSFTQSIWSCVENFAMDNGLTAERYKTKEENYMQTIQKAVENGAKLIIADGSNFETAVYSAQSSYPDVKFLLIDGVPHDEAMNYVNAANTISIIFAEEEAGYLAGYAAVKDGYTKLGFMGGQELPGVKRYGYGFVQGAAAAADELEKKIEMSYIYMGTFESSDDVKKLAADWYKNGTEVIFACGGGMGTSVMKAAEKNNGKVIGVDTDQSSLSASVITSAKKGIDTAVTEMLENYVDDKFIGGTAFNYNAKNSGVSLEMDNGQFKSFKQNDYEKVFKQLKNGKIQLKKDTGVNAVTELTGEWVTIK